jgi:hypothetical protein
MFLTLQRNASENVFYYKDINIAPPAEHCHNLKNTTFQERGKTTGQGDAIAPKEQQFSPLAAIL